VNEIERTVVWESNNNKKKETRGKNGKKNT
jgi:hypothetical protein